MHSVRSPLNAPCRASPLDSFGACYYLPAPSPHERSQLVFALPTIVACVFLSALVLVLTGSIDTAMFHHSSSAGPSTRVQNLRRPQIAVRAVPDGTLPTPPSGLGYYTSSQVADIMGHYSANVDWKAWEERMEEQAPPLADTMLAEDDFYEEEPPFLARFTVVGGGILAGVLLVGTALRALAPGASGGSAAAAPAKAVSVAQGQVPKTVFNDINGAAEAKAQLQAAVTHLAKQQAGVFGTFLVGPSSDSLQLALAIAGQAAVPAYSVSLPQQTEELNRAAKSAAAIPASLLVLNLTDTLDMQALVTVLSAIDDLEASGKAVAVVAVAQRADLLPSALTKSFPLRVEVLGEQVRSDVQAQLARALDEEEALKAATAGPNGEFWRKFDDAVWDFVEGGKEKKWNPDRRDNKERVTKENSSLSWGGYRPVTDDYALSTLEAMAAGMKAQADERMAMQRQRTSLEQKSRGADEKEVLDSRIYMEATTAEVPDGVDRVLTGRQLAELCYQKYGYYYDMALLKFKPLGDTMAKQIAFNIYGANLGSPSFSYSESQYLQKLEMVAQILNRFDQAWYVRQFLLEPIRPRRGLPSTPRADTAVTLRLNTSPTWQYLSDSLIDEFFP